VRHRAVACDLVELLLVINDARDKLIHLVFDVAHFTASDTHNLEENDT